jgi:hypothetical protein
MGTTNQPFGNFLHPSLPFMNLGAGVRFPGGTIVPPGGRVSYVRSTGPQDGDDQTMLKRLHTTLNSALAQCRSGMGDIVIVLPGHSESIATADAMSNLVAGTKIIGMGTGNERPTFTWTATGSTFLLDVANVTLQNLILNLEPGAGTVTVTAPITISAAGCAITGCKIRMGTSATAKVAIGITTTAAADDLVMAGNEIYSDTTAECTTMIQFVGADRLKFLGNTVVGATSAATVGVIRFLTTESLDIKMFHNVLRNNKAGGGATDNVVTGMAAVSGEVDHLFMTCLGNHATNLTAAWGTPASIVFGSNVYIANTIAERAALYGTVSA